MKFTTLLTATLVSTGIVLSAVATPAFAQGKSDKTGDNKPGGGKPAQEESTENPSACPSVGGTPLCLGAFDGNDQHTGISNLEKILGGTWTQADRTELGSGNQTGTWNTGLTGAGAFAVKAGGGDQGGYLLFQTNDISTINWSTLGLIVGNGNTPGMSHVSVYTGGPGGGPQQEVPEPLTLLGSGLALGFGGMFQKKRNAKKSAK